MIIVSHRAVVHDFPWWLVETCRSAKRLLIVGPRGRNRFSSNG